MAEDIKAYELSEYGVDFLRCLALMGAYPREGELFERNLYATINKLSKMIETNSPEICESDKKLLLALKYAHRNAKEYNKDISGVFRQFDRLRKTISDCADRGWIDENDIENLRHYWV